MSLLNTTACQASQANNSVAGTGILSARSGGNPCSQVFWLTKGARVTRVTRVTREKASVEKFDC
eukprot:1161321-Pelagomonas_calceolata.AAC.6